MSLEDRIQAPNGATIWRVENVVGSPLDACQGGERAPAVARAIVRREGSTIAYAIADQGHILVQESRADQFSRRSARHLLSPLSNLKPTHFRPEVESTGRALSCRRRDFCHAIGLSDRAPKGTGDRVALMIE